MKYRDKKTGRFVSAAKWKRSKAQGGTRYKRERAKKKKKREVTPPRELRTLREYEDAYAEAEEFEEQEEIEGGADYGEG